MKVIIVGGGIAGLTFASALEKAGIDFVLLEARSLFDPQVGASIAIQASAMRIFDQLGAAQEIMDQTSPIMNTRQRRNDGSLIMKPSPTFQLTEKRYVEEFDELLLQQITSLTARKGSDTVLCSWIDNLFFALWTTQSKQGTRCCSTRLSRVLSTMIQG
jgi:2-polyprenyl-6-methoxyphenol hydroxylase-like FAD-dependent oxidoreductase